MRRFSPITELTVATVAFSTMGLFPKLVHGNALALCFARAVFATAGLGLVVAWKRTPLVIDRRDAWRMALMGVLSAGNWAGFFAAVQVAGASVAVIALFTNPLIASILEPFLFEEPHNRFEILAGAAVVVGVCLVVPSFSLADHTMMGVALGILSALSLTLRNLFGRRLMPRYGALTGMFWQFAICIPLFAPFGIPWIPKWTPVDWDLLLVMGALLTSFSQTLFYSNLGRVTSSYASLLTCAQPVMTVALAIAFLGERPSARTLLGGIIITATVIAVALHGRGRRVEPE